MFDSSMVNEPSGFEPLKFYLYIKIERHCLDFMLYFEQLQHTFQNISRANSHVCLVVAVNVCVLQ